MRRILTCLVLAAFLACATAIAEDDDHVMGIWIGKSAAAGWESRTLVAKIWGTSKITWDGSVTILDGANTLSANANPENVASDVLLNALSSGKPAGEGTLTGAGSDNKATITGTVKVGGEYAFEAAANDGRMTGQLTKKPAESVNFQMRRVSVKSPTIGAPAPQGATVLFDGKNLDGWNAMPEKWALVDDGAMEISNPQLATKQEFGSAKLHLEFRTPYMPRAGVGSQERGNSGVYVEGRYEVQVLDSFGAKPADNLCGGIYKIAVPIADATLPPLTWQTYDIEFHAAKFDASGKKTQDAEITVLHNGVRIHDHLKLPNPTPGGVSDQDAKTGPLLLQHHRNAVRYRNIWMQPIQD
ncbi:MAG: DUF1080 domain-containing protein [Candidatus Hydrogenedentes bacterium]|nr:DUF1080 domain-containing protein [Candidatus Hydrogenedentota bacterium]